MNTLLFHLLIYYQISFPFLYPPFFHFKLSSSYLYDTSFSPYCIAKDQLARVERLKATSELTDYSKLDKIIVGTIDGDGIGPVIMKSCRTILEKLLADEIAAGKIELRDIPGLTLENRIAKMETVPADVLAAIKECHVLLKGPTTTPGKGDNLPNIESANVTLRRELDLFANVRPVVIPENLYDTSFSPYCIA